MPSVLAAADPRWQPPKTAFTPTARRKPNAQPGTSRAHYARAQGSNAIPPSVVNGVLVRLNLTTIPAGAQQIRLKAVDGTGDYAEQCVVEMKI